MISNEYKLFFVQMTLDSVAIMLRLDGTNK